MADDYVPKPAKVELGTGDFDYTQTSNAHNPLVNGGVDLGSLTLDVNTLTGTSDQEIEKSTYRPPPEGIHTFDIIDIEFVGGMVTQNIPSFVKDRESPRGYREQPYDSYKVKITYAIPGDKNCRINDLFVLPPKTGRPKSLFSYENGFSDPERAVKGDDDGGGSNAKRWRYWLNKLFTPDANGQSPPEASNPLNWLFYPGTNIHRQIIFEVTKPSLGRPYPKKDQSGRPVIGPDGKQEMVVPNRAFPQIRMYSYKAAPEPAELLKFRHAEAQASIPKVDVKAAEKKKATV